MISRFMLIALTVVFMATPTLVQAQYEINRTSRVWIFEHDRSPAMISVLAVEFESPDEAWSILLEQIETGYLERYLDDPAEVTEHSLDLWCYMFEGDVPPEMQPLVGGVQFICPVGEYIYTVVLFGAGYVQAAVEIVEDLILYDQPAVPDDWQDVTEDVLPS